MHRGATTPRIASDQQARGRVFMTHAGHITYLTVSKGATERSGGSSSLIMLWLADYTGREPYGDEMHALVEQNNNKIKNKMTKKQEDTKEEDKKQEDKNKKIKTKKTKTRRQIT